METLILSTPKKQDKNFSKSLFFIIKVFLLSSILVFIIMLVSIKMNLISEDHNQSEIPHMSMEQRSTKITCPKGEQAIWSNCSCSYVCMDDKKANNPLRLDCGRYCD